MTRSRSYSYNNEASSSSASFSDAVPSSSYHRSYRPDMEVNPHFVSTTYVDSLPHSRTHTPLTPTHLAQMSISETRRRYGPPATPSSTSVSDGEDEVETDQYTVQRMRAGSVWEGVEGDRKGKGRIGMGVRRNTIRAYADVEVDGTGLVNQLPPEILRQVLKHLPSNRDVKSALLVNRSWCISAFSLLWNKPSFTQTTSLVGMLRVLASREPTFPYASTIRRLNLAHIAVKLNDPLFSCLSDCTQVERLTLAGAVNISAPALHRVVKGMTQLVAVDFSDVVQIEDEVVIALAEHCPNLQGLNLSGCKKITDVSIGAIARCCPNLKRLKLIKCASVTAGSLVSLAESCPLLLEVDLAFVNKVSDEACRSIWINATQLRELRFTNCIALTEAAIPYLTDLRDEIEVQGVNDQAEAYPITSIFIPAADTLDHLRIVDFTGCNLIGDEAIDNMILNAPKLRTITLAKCTALTDQSLYSLARLGKHLHHIHLGHIPALTDTAVKWLVQQCTRLRFIDIACCSLLTDESVIEIARCLPKLKRVGLVKVTAITDDAVYALAVRHSSLERIHLSYCDKITTKSITYLVSRLRGLTHLSLTGVQSFTVPELQQFCRRPPADFNEHQASNFCVFSGQGVQALREHLLHVQALNAAGSDDGHSRRDSESSASTNGGEPYHMLPHQSRNSWQYGHTEAAPIRSSAFTSATTHQPNYNFFGAPHTNAIPPFHQHTGDLSVHEGVQAWRQQTAPLGRRAVVFESQFSTATPPPELRSYTPPRRRSDGQDEQRREGRSGRQGSPQVVENSRDYRPPGAYVLDY